MSERILATIEAADYIGRSGDADALRRHAAGESKSNGLWLLSAPALGASELLKQTYDSLFNEQGDTIPIYFAVKASDATAKNCAARFLNTVISQMVAFRQRNAGLLDASNINELVELAAPEDADWIQRLTANRRIDEELNDERAFIRGCFSAVTRGAKFFVMIDDLHEAAYLKGENDFVEELKDVYSRANIRFVFSGRRRFLYGATQTGKLNGAKILRLEPLNHADAGFLAENTARRFDVKINEQARDLIARKFDGNPTYIKFLILAANAAKVDLDSFQRVEKLYTDQIFGGAFGGFYDAILAQIAPEITAQKKIVALIYNSLTVEKEKVPIETWRERAGLDDADFYRVMSLLNAAENLIRIKFFDSLKTV